MNRISIFLALSISLAMAGCKKEELAPNNAQQLVSNTSDRLNKVVFINGIGYAVGGERFNSATISISYDGGTTWQAKSFPQAGKGIYGITEKYDELGVFTIGHEGGMLSSTDDGQNWNYNFLGTWRPYKDLALIEPLTCICIGGISFSTGYLDYFKDDGTLYRSDSLSYELNDIEMINNKTGYICGFGVVQKTDDGAVTWQQLDIHNENFTAMHIKNAQELWVCGYNGSVYHTANGGTGWDKQRNGNSVALPKYRLLDIYFKNDNNGWAVGEEGAMLYTKNGGSEWKAYKKFTDQALRSIAQAPDGNLIVCGDNGTLYKLMVN